MVATSCMLNGFVASASRTVFLFHFRFVHFIFHLIYHLRLYISMFRIISQHECVQNYKWYQCSYKCLSIFFSFGFFIFYSFVSLFCLKRLLVSMWNALFNLISEASNVAIIQWYFIIKIKRLPSNSWWTLPTHCLEWHDKFIMSSEEIQFSYNMD